MKKLFAIAMFLLASCAKNNMVGTFSAYTLPYRFILKSDSTFQYHYKEGFLYAYSFGKWRKISERKVELKSFYQERKLLLTGSEEKVTNNANTVGLTIKTPIPDDDKNYYKCLIYLNGKFFTMRTCDSLNSITLLPPIKSVLLKITTDIRMPIRDNDTLVSTEFHPLVNNPSVLNLNCSYNDSLFNYKIFKNYTLNFSNGKMKYMNFKLSRNLKYRPQ